VSKWGRGVWIWIWMRRTCHVWSLRERKVGCSYKMTFRVPGIIMRITMSPAFNSTALHYLKSLWLTCRSIIFKRFGQFEVQSFFSCARLWEIWIKKSDHFPDSFLVFVNNELTTEIMWWKNNNKKLE